MSSEENIAASKIIKNICISCISVIYHPHISLPEKRCIHICSNLHYEISYKSNECHVVVSPLHSVKPFVRFTSIGDLDLRMWMCAFNAVWTCKAFIISKKSYKFDVDCFFFCPSVTKHGQCHFAFETHILAKDGIASCNGV